MMERDPVTRGRQQRLRQAPALGDHHANVGDEHLAIADQERVAASVVPHHRRRAQGCEPVPIAGLERQRNAVTRPGRHGRRDGQRVGAMATLELGVGAIEIVCVELDQAHDATRFVRLYDHEELAIARSDVSIARQPAQPEQREAIPARGEHLERSVPIHLEQQAHRLEILCAIELELHHPAPVAVPESGLEERGEAIPVVGLRRGLDRRRNPGRQVLDARRRRRAKQRGIARARIVELLEVVDVQVPHAPVGTHRIHGDDGHLERSTVSAARSEQDGQSPAVVEREHVLEARRDVGSQIAERAEHHEILVAPSSGLPSESGGGPR